MAGAVALTTIKYGDGDKVTVVPEGEEVSGKGLPSDLVKDLKAQGLVGEPPKTTTEQNAEVAELEEENEKLSAQVAELKKQLEAAKSGPATPEKK